MDTLRIIVLIGNPAFGGMGVVMSKEGDPICCEYWPGNMSDIEALLQVVEVLKGRFRIRRIILVCDKGMMSQSNLEELKKEGIDFIVGVRLRADARPQTGARLSPSERSEESNTYHELQNRDSSPYGSE